jgi:hypothetical protein
VVRRGRTTAERSRPSRKQTGRPKLMSGRCCGGRGRFRSEAVD